jgi:hypothetical protein
MIIDDLVELVGSGFLHILPESSRKAPGFSYGDIRRSRKCLGTRNEATCC